MVWENRQDLVLGCTHTGKIISGETGIAKFEILGFLATLCVMHAGVYLPGQTGRGRQLSKIFRSKGLGYCPFRLPEYIREGNPFGKSVGDA